MLDALLATEELPEEYRDRCQVPSNMSSLFGGLAFERAGWHYDQLFLTDYVTAASLHEK